MWRERSRHSAAASLCRSAPIASPLAPQAAASASASVRARRAPGDGATVVKRIAAVDAFGVARRMGEVRRVMRGGVVEVWVLWVVWMVVV